MAKARPILPNAPIADVTCELRFHGDLGLFAAWAGVQHDLRDQFPQMLVPGAVVGTSPLLQHVQLANQQNSRAVLLSINSFAYETREYAGYDKYREDLLRIASTFLKHAPPLRFTRFGLRYINVLPEFEPSGPSIHPALKLSLAGWNLAGGTLVEQPTMGVLVRLPQNLTLRVSVYQGEVTPPPVALPIVRSLSRLAGPVLDFDIASSEGLDKPKALEAFLTAGHDVLDDVFFELVTPAYYNSMKG